MHHQQQQHQHATAAAPHDSIALPRLHLKSEDSTPRPMFPFSTGALSSHSRRPLLCLYFFATSPTPATTCRAGHTHADAFDSNNFAQAGQEDGAKEKKKKRPPQVN